MVSGMGRASSSKRAARQSSAPAGPAPLAMMLPRSVEALGRAQVEAVQRIQQCELERREVERQLDTLVLKGRRAGISWAALGWALGITGQAAQQRYAKRLEP